MNPGGRCRVHEGISQITWRRSSGHSRASGNPEMSATCPGSHFHRGDELVGWPSSASQFLSARLPPSTSCKLETAARTTDQIGAAPQAPRQRSVKESDTRRRRRCAVRVDELPERSRASPTSEPKMSEWPIGRECRFSLQVPSAALPVGF